jgi:hypothetical protein
MRMLFREAWVKEILQETADFCVKTINCTVFLCYSGGFVSKWGYQCPMHGHFFLGKLR